MSADADEESPLVMDSLQAAKALGAADRASTFVVLQQENYSTQYKGADEDAEKEVSIMRRQSKIVASSALAGSMRRQTKIGDDLVGESQPTKVMADGPWQCNPPRLRRQGVGDQFEKEKRGYGQITREEALWLILISLAFARNRDDIEVNHEVIHYILHFFILWTVLFSCILYSARFNDRDFFHAIIWNCVMLGLLFLVGSLNQGARTMGWSAFACHATIAVANARVAIYLPEARVYCSWMTLQSVANACAMACLTFVNCTGVAYQVLLWINVFLQPFMYTIYKGIIAALDYVYTDVGDGVGFGLACHVPADFSYIFARWQGVHVLTIIGAFFSSIALYAGNAIAINTNSKIIAMCGFTFALILKTTILDVDVVSKSGYDSLRHPYRRSYATSRIFLLLFPYSVLCIALTGMGFYVMTLDAAGLATVVSGENTEAFARKLMSIAPACAWIILTTNKALTKPRVTKIHWPKVVILYVLAMSFLVPAVLEFTRVWSAVWVTAVQLFVLLVMLIAMFVEKEERERQTALMPGMYHTRSLAKAPSEYGTWNFKDPTLLQEWEEFDTNTQIGTQMDSHELFSTVLLGVSLETMSLEMQDKNSFSPTMALYFVTMYGAFAMMMRYSCRFSLTDISHRFAWSIYQFLMLLQIVGMRFELDTLFAAASAVQYFWVAIGFWLRIAWKVPRGRPYALYCIVICFLLAIISSVRCFTASAAMVWPVFTGVLLLSIFSEPALNVTTWYFMDANRRQDVLLPMNVEYLNNRMNGSFVMIISVCMIKGGTLIFWGTMNHPGLAAICVVCIGFMAMSAMSAHFHTDVVSAQRHAIHRGEIPGMLYLVLHPCILLSMALMGGLMYMLLSAVGEYGILAYSAFAKDGFCISAAVFKLLVAVFKNLHGSRPEDQSAAGVRLQGLRTKISILSCVLCLLPLPISSMRDFSTLIYITAMSSVTRYLYLVVNMYGDDAQRELKEKRAAEKKRKMSRRNSSIPLL